MFEELKKPVGVLYDAAAYCLLCWDSNPAGKNIYKGSKEWGYNPSCNYCWAEIPVHKEVKS